MSKKSLQLAREAKSRPAEGVSLGNLGSAYYALGDAYKAIEHHEQALAVSREVGDRRGEGADLGSLGNAYTALGNVHKAIEYYEQALVIAREIGDKRAEGIRLNNIADVYADIDENEASIDCFKKALVIRRKIFDRYGVASTLGNLARRFIERGNYKDAIQFALESIDISQEIGSPLLGSRHRYTLALAQICTGDLSAAHDSIEQAIMYDVPENNHNATALHGIIALRQSEREIAQEAFTKSIAQADEILAKTAEYYSALDAKGLALCGRAVSREWTVENNKERDEIVAAAIETFRKARKIAPHAGIVKSVLRLFDELAKCDEEGVLKDVRKAVEGS